MLCASDSVDRIRTALQTWYAREKRDLPWRRTRDPYAIWLSEAMLQQTRVETVIEYWQRFLEALPDVRALAAADEEQVLGLWSGLGYYRRARQLHAAAKYVVAQHAGVFPRSAKALLELPGVGRYTAGAISSIAFDEPEPLVDGNVARVFCRLFVLAGEPHSSALQKRLWQYASELVPRVAAGDWNQALMELGATLCKSATPECERCPLQGECGALATGRVAELPWPKKRPQPVEVELEIHLAEREGRWLLRQRASDEPRMPGLWEFPTREDSESGLFPRELPDLELVPGEPFGELRHGITRHKIRARLLRSELRGRVSSPTAWFTVEELQSLPLTGMSRKALERVLAGSSAGKVR